MVYPNKNLDWNRFLENKVVLYRLNYFCRLKSKFGEEYMSLRSKSVGVLQGFCCSSLLFYHASFVHALQSSILKEVRLFYSHWSQPKFFPQMSCLFFSSCFFCGCCNFNSPILNIEKIVQDNMHSLFLADVPLNVVWYVLGRHRSFSLFHQFTSLQTCKYQWNMSYYSSVTSKVSSQLTAEVFY